MKSINDSVRFSVPKSRRGVDQAIFDFYARNTYVRYADNDEDPQELCLTSDRRQGVVPAGYAIVKDVRNVHINSDHQRAYVWTITTLHPEDASQVEQVNNDR